MRRNHFSEILGKHLFWGKLYLHILLTLFGEVGTLLFWMMGVTFQCHLPQAHLGTPIPKFPKLIQSAYVESLSQEDLLHHGFVKVIVWQRPFKLGHCDQDLKVSRLQTDQGFKANRTQIDKFCLDPQTLCKSKLMTTTTMDAAVIMPGTTASQPPQPKKKKPWNQESTSNHPVGVCQNSSKRSISKSVTCNSKTMSYESHIVCPTSYEGKHAIKTLEQSKLGNSGLWICPNPVTNRCRCWAVRDLLPILPAEMLMHMASLARNLYL